MKIVKPQAFLESKFNREDALKLIERAGRVCYKSEDKIHDGSASKFIKNIVRSGHNSVIEHVSVSFRIVCSRACSHQIVRHRLASYSQMSQRYVKSGSELEVVVPPSILAAPKAFDAFEIYMDTAAEEYYILTEQFKIKPEDARFVLPNAVATELVMTANLREWLHFINLRGSPRAQWEIQAIANDVKVILKSVLPELFNE